MRKTAIVAFSLAIILLFANTQAFAQQVLPDYTKWQKDSSSISAVHNGKDVSLYVELYENLDVDNLYQHSILVIHDEQKRSWIAFYTRVIFYKDGDHLVVAGYNYWLFDYSNNSWSFVKDFSQIKDQDLDKEADYFLKNQYDLVWK